MNIVTPVVEMYDCNGMMKTIEWGGRKCYKSEDRIGPGTDKKFAAMINTPKNGLYHNSVNEHAYITVGIILDRGVSHELVRHRHLSPSQESTRYVNYSKDKFGRNITIVEPYFFDSTEEPQEMLLPSFYKDSAGVWANDGSEKFLGNSFDVWMISCLWAEWAYMTLIGVFKRTPQEARSVLPNSTKTEIAISANATSWKHVFALRTHRDAHPQMRQIMVPLAKEFAKLWPELFGQFKDVEHPCPAQVVYHENFSYRPISE